MEGRKWNGYVEKEKKKEEEKKMTKKKKNMDHGTSPVLKSLAPNYLIGKDMHVGRDCRIWRIRLFL